MLLFILKGLLLISEGIGVSGKLLVFRVNVRNGPVEYDIESDLSKLSKGDCEYELIASCHHQGILSSGHCKRTN